MVQNNLKMRLTHYFLIHVGVHHTKRKTSKQWNLWRTVGRIQHLGSNKLIKTLGSMTCPSGCSKGAITYMQTKGGAWKDMVKAGKLSRCNVWFMLEKQFWP
jgi:hypothetical protein